jgi:hydrogenase maturation protease
MLRVIALGNELYGDDGIGPAVLRQMQSRVRRESVDLIDAANDALILLDYLVKGDPVVLIDCARMGRNPGEVLKFRSGRLQPPWLSGLLSLHGLSIREVLELARELGWSGECVIIGIEPKAVAFNSDLSAEISRNLPAIVDLAMEEINKYGEKSIDH